MQEQTTVKSQKIRVLLADDSRLILAMEKAFFPESDFITKEARTGLTAYTQALNWTPDIIFLDYYMPEINGDDICRMLRANPSFARTPIVIVTKARPEYVDKCHMAGCDLVIQKPIRRESIYSALTQYLGWYPPQLRHQVVLQAEIILSDSQVLHHTTVDISEGGVFVEMDNDLPVDTPLTLRLLLSKHQEISVQCRVAWINSGKSLTHRNLPKGIGLQFVNLDLEDMWVIRELILEQERMLN